MAQLGSLSRCDRCGEPNCAIKKSAPGGFLAAQPWSALCQQRKCQPTLDAIATYASCVVTVARGMPTDRVPMEWVDRVPSTCHPCRQFRRRPLSTPRHQAACRKRLDVGNGI